MSPIEQHRPELSSLLATLDELLRRIESTATRCQGEETGSRLAADLFAVETNLRTGRRRLEKALRSS